MAAHFPQACRLQDLGKLKPTEFVPLSTGARNTLSSRPTGTTPSSFTPLVFGSVITRNQNSAASGLLDPQPENLVAAASPDTQVRIDRLVPDGRLVPDLDGQRVVEDDRVSHLRRAIMPFGYYEPGTGRSHAFQVTTSFLLKTRSANTPS